MTLSVLDRLAVDDAGRSPAAIAAEIHRQLGRLSCAVPVFEIARALDIEDIRQEPLSHFEGMLLTEAHRDFGLILINANSGPQRRRYSLAHELGHFLCNWHRPTQGTDGGFRCSRFDMARPVGDELHVSQEREANSFAIELLAPGYLVAPYLRRLPDLDHVLSMHRALDISRIAAARRYVAFHMQPLAVVVARSSCFEYADRGLDFPFLRFDYGDRLPDLPGVTGVATTSEMIDADPEDWRLRLPNGSELSVQSLPPEGGRALILLHIEPAED